jgi:hypothetical protein
MKEVLSPFSVKDFLPKINFVEKIRLQERKALLIKSLITALVLATIGYVAGLAYYFHYLASLEIDTKAITEKVTQEQKAIYQKKIDNLNEAMEVRRNMVIDFGSFDEMKPSYLQMTPRQRMFNETWYEAQQIIEKYTK